jgi:putative restriction endonuclease
MKFYVGVTDQDWFDFLKKQPFLDEVNFWQPTACSEFRSLERGDLFLFKLHRNERTRHQDLIAGGGVFFSFSILPISLAWEAFEKKNGADSFEAMKRRLLFYRRIQDKPHEDFQVGCIILTQPFFFEESAWFRVPNWSPSIVRGKSRGYEIEREDGKFIWLNLQHAWDRNRLLFLDKESRRIDEERSRYGKETTIKPRLGQGAFKIAVTDAYHRSCAITEEHTLPALEAAHIKPFSEGGDHLVCNGLLLRSDVHRLFDKGYITITPDLRIEVSRSLKEEFSNGRYYYPFHGKRLHHIPASSSDQPNRELLVWHNEEIFKK